MNRSIYLRKERKSPPSRHADGAVARLVSPSDQAQGRRSQSGSPLVPKASIVPAGAGREEEEEVPVCSVGKAELLFSRIISTQRWVFLHHWWKGWSDLVTSIAGFDGKSFFNDSQTCSASVNLGGDFVLIDLRTEQLCRQCWIT